MTRDEHIELSKQVQALVDELQKTKRTIEEKEDEINLLKRQVKTLEQIQIPDLMFENGVSSLTLFSGTNVLVKPYYNAKVPKENPEPFFQWLREHGHGALVKAHFQEYISSVDDIEFLKRALKELEVSFTVKENVHPKTLTAWFKEQTEKGEQLPLQLFDNFMGNTTVVK